MSDLARIDLVALAPCAFFVVAVPILFSLGLRNARRRREHAQALAQDLGFELADGSDALRHALGDPSNPRFGNLTAEQSRTLARVLSVVGQMSNGFRMVGRHRGYDTTIQSVSRGSGKNRKTYTAFRMSLPSALGLGLQLGREGFLDKIGATITGNRDVQVGDADFDARVLVRAQDVESTRTRLARSTVREPILALLAIAPGATVDDQKIAIELIGARLRRDEVRPILERMADVAAALSS